MMCNNMFQLSTAGGGPFSALLLGLEHRYYGGAAFDAVPWMGAAQLGVTGSLGHNWLVAWVKAGNRAKLG